ncbi:uncharacterized protein LOC144736557 [Lampetra planeri]
MDFPAAVAREASPVPQGPRARWGSRELRGNGDNPDLRDPEGTLEAPGSQVPRGSQGSLEPRASKGSRASLQSPEWTVRRGSEARPGASAPQAREGLPGRWAYRVNKVTPVWTANLETREMWEDGAPPGSQECPGSTGSRAFPVEMG